MKLANIDREIIHIFWTNWRISMKSSGNMCFMIILKVRKNQGFHPLFGRYILGRGVSNWPPAVLGLKEKRNTSIYLKKLWNVIWSCNSFRKDCQNGLQHLRTTYETHRNRKKHTYIDTNSFYMRSKTKFTRNAISFRHNKNSV